MGMTTLLPLVPPSSPGEQVLKRMGRQRAVQQEEESAGQGGLG